MVFLTEWRIPGAPFEVRVTRSPTAVRVDLIGELDFSGVDCLARFVDDFLAGRPPSHEVVWDLTGLTFVDARGVRAIRDACARLTSGGMSVSFCGIQPVVRMVLDLTGISFPDGTA